MDPLAKRQLYNALIAHCRGSLFSLTIQTTYFPFSNFEGVQFFGYLFIILFERLKKFGFMVGTQDAVYVKLCEEIDSVVDNLSQYMTRRGESGKNSKNAELIRNGLAHGQIIQPNKLDEFHSSSLIQIPEFLNLRDDEVFLWNVNNSKEINFYLRCKVDDLALVLINSQLSVCRYLIDNGLADAEAPLFA
mmetsp:Transcript_20470/g.28172  ORF Transcript_20470/g.28172 Transcript_20470/m.28172 type:complete len:190 (+) Transcript_20470:42-611(+)